MFSTFVATGFLFFSDRRLGRLSYDFSDDFSFVCAFHVLVQGLERFAIRSSLLNGPEK